MVIAAVARALAALLVFVLTPRMGRLARQATTAASPERVPVVGLGISLVGLDAATDQVVRWAAEPVGRYVCAANVHMVMECHDVPAFGDVVRGADLVLPDGMPLVFAQRVDVMKRLATTSTVVARKPHNSNAVSAAGGWRPAMDHGGIDSHKRESQLCMLDPEKEVTEVRISTTRERFRAVLGDQPRAKVLIESSTESEWVARCLEGLGHEVIVADPGFAPMYGMRRRRVKTDVPDARALRSRKPAALAVVRRPAPGQGWASPGDSVGAGRLALQRDVR